MRKKGQCLSMVGVAPLILLVLVTSAWGQKSTGSYNIASIGSLREALESVNTREEQLSALWALADAYRQQGRYREALRHIENADAISQTNLEQTLTALRWGNIAIGLGMYAAASSILSVASAGKSLLDESSTIALELELGHLAVELKLLDKAVGHFDAAVSQANRAQLPVLETKARVNALRARMDNQDLAGLEDLLAELHRLVGELGQEDQTAFLLLASGDLHRRAVNEFKSKQALLGVAYDDYLKAREYARSAKTRSDVFGFLGALYEGEGRLDEAHRLTSEAVFYAQEARVDEQLYRWEWQLGRIFRARGQLDDARKAYQRAVTVLERVRPNFVLGSRDTFKTLVAPVYAEYADVLLLQSSAAPTRNQSQTLLTEVRNQLETLKQGEIEDYFGNQCVVTTDPDSGPGKSRETGVAVIYPVLLDDRIEVLVEAGGSLLQFTTPVGEGEATQAIRELRLNLERSNSGTAYLEPAQRLYQWLIAPSIEMFEELDVQTLMMVPGGALRTIPLAALHDGERFLIERYAVANTPAIGLLKKIEPEETSNLLIGGLTQSVQGFSALPSVAREIDIVSSMYPSRVMLDETFKLDAVQRELVSSDFSIAHFATHGEFSEDFAKSFILTYDDKLTLNNLKNILDSRGGDPLDLLVLSACETAAGDDRAALGLAGVAVQSGARSAVASLWYISDVAAAELISTFYQNLQSSRMTKAEALRQAQLSLLATENFGHPSYWAPFLLIGSWL